MNRWPDWLKQAQRDLEAAGNSARAGYHEWAAFAAQQSAEKAVKALVHFLQGSTRGHSITAFFEALPASVPIPEGLLDSARELDQVYLTARYPNGFASGSPADYFTEKSSQRLIGHARSIFEFCRSQIR